jgi:predicted ATPase/transcriptional regulator with XRE-family HTH domain
MASGTDLDAHAVTATFGSLLRHLRLRARLTQRDLAIAVNYSEAQICRLEQNRRSPDLAALVALFFPALGLDEVPADAARLLDLAAAARGDARPEPLAQSAGQERTPGQGRQPGAPDAQPHDLQPLNLAIAMPLPATPLIGRGHEQAALAALLASADVRLVTVLGPPGVGKTHLAFQAAHDIALRGVETWLVDLTTINDPALVLPAIARALGLDERVGGSVAALAEALRQRPMLLVLDNLEQVREAARDLAMLLRGAPQLTILATSRAALRLSAEHVVQLEPLPVPNLANLEPLAALAQNESVALLTARLRAANPSFVLSEANALAVAAICARVDGLPLALELVAARGGLLTPQELLTEVAQQYQRLRRRTRDIPSRQQSLQAALEWSVAQLDPAALHLYERLGVCVGPWTLEAARAIVSPDDADAVLDGLATLCEHSLVQRHSAGAATLFTMLTVIREDALVRLNARGTGEDARERHLAYYRGLAERAALELRGPNQPAWLARLDPEHDNLRAALSWAQARGAASDGLRLGAALWRYWYMRGYPREGRAWLATFLAMPDEAPVSIVRAAALAGAGILAWQLGDFPAARVWLDEALARYRQAGDQEHIGQILGYQGLLAENEGDLGRAMALQEQALAVAREQGDTYAVAGALHNLGNLAYRRGDRGRAVVFYEESLAYYRQWDDQSGMALLYLGLGAIAHDQGDLGQAHSWFTQSLNLARQVGDDWNIAEALGHLGSVMFDLGDDRAAEQTLSESLALFTKLGAQLGIAVARSRMAGVALARGERSVALAGFCESLQLARDVGAQSMIAEALEGIAACVSPVRPAEAVRLVAAADSLRATLGEPVRQAARYDQTLAQARTLLGDSTFAATWELGRASSLEGAIALGLGEERRQRIREGHERHV